MKKSPFKAPKNCKECNGTGYKSVSGHGDVVLAIPIAKKLDNWNEILLCSCKGLL